MPAYQGTPRKFETKAAVAKWAGEPAGATGLQSGGYAGKSKLFGSCFSPSFVSDHLGKARLVGFGPGKDVVKEETYNKVLVPHIEEAFRRIKALNLPYALRTINGYQFRYAKTDRNQAALMGRPEYVRLRARPNWGGSWNTLCAELDLQESRFDEMVPERGLPKRDILSNHSYGSAFDLNVPENPFSSAKEFDMPLEIVRLLENMGFYWGGRYHDYMHFEWVDPRPPAGSSITLSSGMRWPLEAAADPQSYLKYFALNEGGNGGYFPIGTRQNIHGGVHLDPFLPSKLADGTLLHPAWKSGSCAVSSFLPGYVVAARCFPEPGGDDPRLVEATEARPLGFVLVRHELTEPAAPKSDSNSETNGEPAKPPKVFYALYMHLDPPALGAAPDEGKRPGWLETLLGMQHGCLVNLDPHASGLAVGEVKWLSGPAAADASEARVRGGKEPTKVVGADGQRLAFIKDCPEEVRQAVEAFRHGAVVTMDAPLLPVAAGDVLGTISPTRGAGYLHWEVFCVKTGESALDELAAKAKSVLGVELREISEQVPDNFIEVPDEKGVGTNELESMFGQKGLPVEDMTDERYPGALRRYMLDPAKFGPGSKVGGHGGATYPMTIELTKDDTVPLKANTDGSPFKVEVCYLRAGREMETQMVSLSPSDSRLNLDVPVEADAVALWSSDLFFDRPPVPQDKAEQHDNAEFEARKKHLGQVLQGRYRNVLLRHINEWTPEGLKAQLDRRMQAGKLANVLRRGDADLEQLTKVFRPITWWGRVQSEDDPAGEVALLGKNGKVETLFGTQAEHHQLPRDADVLCMHPVTCAVLVELLSEQKKVAFNGSWGPVALRGADDVTKPPFLGLVWSGKKNALGAKVTAVLVQHGFASSGSDGSLAVTFKVERTDGAGSVELAAAAYDEGVARAEAYLDWWGNWRLSAWQGGTKLMPALEQDTAVAVAKPVIIPESVEWHPVEGAPSHYKVSVVVKGSRPAQLKGYVVLDYAKTPADAAEPPTSFTPGNIAVPVVFQTAADDKERVVGGLRYKGDFLVGRVKAKENPSVSKSFKFEDFIRMKGTGQRVFEGTEDGFKLILPLLGRLEQLQEVCAKNRAAPCAFRVVSLSEDGQSVVVRPAVPSQAVRLAQYAQRLPDSTLFRTKSDETGGAITLECLLADSDAIAEASVELSAALGHAVDELLDDSSLQFVVQPTLVLPNGGSVAGEEDDPVMCASSRDLARRANDDCIVMACRFHLPPLKSFEFGQLALSFGNKSLIAEIELIGDSNAWARAKPELRLEVDGKELSGGGIKAGRLRHEWLLFGPAKDKKSLHAKLGDQLEVTAAVAAPKGLKTVPPERHASIKIEPCLSDWTHKLVGRNLILEGKANAMPEGQPVEVGVEVEESPGQWAPAVVSMNGAINRQRQLVVGRDGVLVVKVAVSSLDQGRAYRFTWRLPPDGEIQVEPKSLVVDAQPVK